MIEVIRGFMGADISMMVESEMYGLEVMLEFVQVEYGFV
jgi:hypothetical protein